MKILFDKTQVLGQGEKYILVDGDLIRYVGDEKPEGKFDRVINTKNKLVLSGLFNCHTHASMQFLRGYGEDIPLKEWLDEKILPAEEKLNDHIAGVCADFAIAEMIKNGICSFSDMYFFYNDTVKSIERSGIKANISRSIVSFDPDIDVENDYRFCEGVELVKNFNGAFGGRLKVDYSLHGEYTNVEKMCRKVAQKAKEDKNSIQIHVSETKREHEKCIAKYGLTPTAFFEKCGVLDVPAVFSHCVWVSEDDMDIIKEKNVSVVHNPSSNMKLGSGAMPLSKMLEKGINVTLGTDSAASNNTLDILREMNLASLLEKCIDLSPDRVKAKAIYELATKNGAISQRRDDCGCIREGNKADIIMIDLDTINNIPSFDPYYTLLYSANSSNVVFNMVDGKVLYENGEFKTVDIEKTKYEMRKIVKDVFSDM